MIRAEGNVTMPLHTYWNDIEGLSLDPDTIRKTADRIEAEHPVAELKEKVSNLSVAARPGILPTATLPSNSA
jgi:hypothetical protein